MIFFLHALGAHRVKESADVIKDKPINGGAYNRHVEHTTLSLANTERNPRHNYQNGENIGENHDSIEKRALVSRKRRKQGIH